jgi:hypothetical protein
LDLTIRKLLQTQPEDRDGVPPQWIVDEKG